jgi:tRNA nucleotidyltransferase (CCA-adding enzyme)
VIETIKAMPQWELLQQAAQIATGSGWHLYLVGGVVRDLLLAQANSTTLAITDIDLVVDGCHQTADVGAGVQLATALQQLYPAAHLDVHGAFQTAALRWPQDAAFGLLELDIATARTESYPYPAANPIVSTSSIRQDLYRRDFTINALAWRLTPSAEPPLLDLFGGLLDLQNQQIRVLHANSFIDDPTRIFRGARFAVRLGFEFESQSAAYIRAAIASGIYDRTARSHPKTPALQSRLKTELKYLLTVSYWQATLDLLADLGGLQCIHPTLKLDPALRYQLKLLDRCLKKFDPQQQLVHWQVKLELLIAQLDPSYRSIVAQNLQLPTDSISRLEDLDRVEADLRVKPAPLENRIPTCERVSQVVNVLKQHDLELLILVAVRTQTRSIRRQIWQYLTKWRHIQPILTGNDLRGLGYQPGRQYRQILDSLLVATLDGEISDRSSAVEFLARSFQLK